MAHRPSLKRRKKRGLSADLILTPFIDILVALILFLLMTAIFGKASILNLYLPTESQDEPSAAATPPSGSLVPTVAITRDGFILGRGPLGVVRVPLLGEGQYDFNKLRNHLLELHKHPEASNHVIILPEASLRYQTLVTTMDTCREYKDEGGNTQPLFPVVSLGEYRAQVASANPSP